MMINGLYSPFSSPFSNPQPMPQYGVMPLEITMSDGRTINTAPGYNYSPGGMTTSGGGFNPATGMVTPAMGGQGYNPYLQYQMYSMQNMQNNPQYQFANGYIQPSLIPMNGYGMYSPMQIGMNMNGQNPYNYLLQEFLYEEADNLASAEMMKAIENVILTEDEQQKVNRKFIIGYDYYGRPMYGNGNDAYFQNNEYQDKLEQYRSNTQTIYTSLSKISHHYFGEEIDEKAVMERFDPIPKQSSSNQKIFNYYTATDEERKDYENEARYNTVQEINRRFEYEDQNHTILNQKMQAFATLEESYYKILGVPKEELNLENFLANAGKILQSIDYSKAKSNNRNGTRKYSRTDFRQNLATQTSMDIPTSKDDEYVSIEQMLKGVYDRNRAIARQQINQGLLGPNNNLNFNSEQQAHQYFLQEMEKRKKQDDLRKSVI